MSHSMPVGSKPISFDTLRVSFDTLRADDAFELTRILAKKQGESTKVQTQKELPKEIKKIVGKVRLFIVDVFSKISAFFQVLKNWVLGKSTFSMKEISKLASQRSFDKKLQLYFEKTLSPELLAYLKILDYKLSSVEELQEELGDLKKVDSNLFKLFQAIASKKGVDIVEILLRAVKKATPKNYYLVLVEAIKFAKSQNASKEVKSFLIGELQKLEVNGKLKHSEYKRPKEVKRRMLFRAKDGLTTKQKAAIAAAGFTLVVAGGALGYYYLMPAVPTQPEGIVNAVKKGIEGASGHTAMHEPQPAVGFLRNIWNGVIGASGHRAMQS